MSAYYISGDALIPFRDLIEELGGDVEKVFLNAGFEQGLCLEADFKVSYKSFMALLGQAALETGCEHIGLLLGERNGLQNLGLLGLLVRSAPSFKVAIEETNRYLSVHVKGIIRELHIDQEVAWLTTTFEEKYVANSVLAIQMSIATIWNVCGSLSHHLWHPTSIHFTFSEPANVIFYKRFFTCPIVFNADFNGIVFHSSDLNLALQDHDPLLHKEMQRQVSKLDINNKDDFIHDVKKFIRQNLEAGICNIDAVIRFFPFQKRTFQQKLKREGFSYQHLLDDVRFQKAESYLLNSDISVSQLSDLLCYKSVSVFSTAFKNHYGTSPTHWRKYQKKRQDSI